MLLGTSLSLRSNAAFQHKSAAASPSQKIIFVVWLYFSPSRHSDVSLTFQQGLSAGLWVTGKGISQTSWKHLGPSSSPLELLATNPQEKQIRPCTNKVKVTWSVSGQLKHLHLTIKELHSINVSHVSLVQNCQENTKKNPQWVSDPNSSKRCKLPCYWETYCLKQQQNTACPKEKKAVKSWYHLQDKR